MLRQFVASLALLWMLSPWSTFNGLQRIVVELEGLYVANTGGDVRLWMSCPYGTSTVEYRSQQPDMVLLALSTAWDDDFSITMGVYANIATFKMDCSARSRASLINIVRGAEPEQARIVDCCGLELWI